MASHKARNVEPAKDVYRLYEESLKLLHEKKHSKARPLLEKIKEMSSDLELVARANELLKVCEKRTLRTEPADETTSMLVDRGVVLHNSGQYDQALACYSRALEKGNDNLDYIYYAMSASEAAQGSTDKALQHLRKAIELRNEVRFTARSDPDFEKLSDNAAFRELVRPQEK